MARERKIPSTSTKITSKKYGEFLRTIHLAGLGLDQASVAVDRNALASAESQGIVINHEMRVVLKLVHHEDNKFVVGADCELLLKKEKENSETSRLGHIQCSFSALLTTDQNVSKDLVERFASSEAKLVFWPYIRQYVSDTTYKMAINPILIPLTSESTTQRNKD
jgi:hypothetical protein